MNIVAEKRCLKCGLTKPADSFAKEKRNTSTGLRSYCKKCEYADRTKLRRKNPEKARATAKIYRSKNVEKIKKQRNARYPFYAIAQRASHKLYYQENKEVMKKNARQYAKDNAEVVKERHRKYYQTNLEKMRELSAQASNKRRSITKGKYDIKEWKNLCSKYDNRCLCCGKVKKLTVDHVLPISKGGANTIDNLQPLCQSCNSSKGTKHIDYRQGQYATNSW